MELRYFRDTDGREVDFVVVEGGRPLLLVEAKWGDTEPEKSLRYLKAKRKQTFISIITLISIGGVALGVTALIVVLAAPSMAQDQRGSIEGTIRDSSGGVLPGVTVEARSPSLVGVATAVLSPTIALSGDGLGPGVGCLKHESLLALGCDEYQGFYASPALPPLEFERREVADVARDVREHRREGAEPRRLGKLHVSFGDVARPHPLDFLEHQLRREHDRLVLGLAEGLERPRVVDLRLHRRVRRVGEAVVGPHDLGDARRERPAAQRVVHQVDGRKVGVVARQPDVADLDDALVRRGALRLHHIDAGLGGLLHTDHAGQDDHGASLGQLNLKAQSWWELSYAELGAALKTSFKLRSNPLKNPRTADEWEPYLAEKGAEVDRQTRELADAEAELNDHVFALFHLTQAEIELLQREVEH